MKNMKKNISSNIFSATNTLKILSFLVENLGKEFLGSEIQKATAISRAGVYIALRDLISYGLAIKIQKGKFLLYTVAYDNPIVRQFKVLNNILLLKPVISKLKFSSKKIILYGSASRGEDYSESDIDLFLLSKDPEVTKSILPTLKIKRKIQAVVKSPSELADLKEKDKVFYKEVERGIVLWEERE